MAALLDLSLPRGAGDGGSSPLAGHCGLLARRTGMYSYCLGLKKAEAEACFTPSVWTLITHTSANPFPGKFPVYTDRL